MGKVMVKDVILRNHRDENWYEAGVITQKRLPNPSHLLSPCFLYSKSLLATGLGYSFCCQTFEIF